MSPLKNNRLGFWAWMFDKMVPNAWVFVTHSLSWGRIAPVRLGAPPCAKGFMLAARNVVASALAGSVRLSPTVAKLKMTGSELCACTIPKPANDANEAMSTRRTACGIEDLLCMNSLGRIDCSAAIRCAASRRRSALDVNNDISHRGDNKTAVVRHD